VLHGAVRWLVYLLAAIALLQAWGLDAVGWLSSEPTRVLGGTLFRVLLILGASIATWEVSNGFIQSYLEAKDGSGEVKVRSARIRTLMAVARNALMAGLSVVATLLILSELGINIAPLLAGAGVVGLAVGFGAQTLVKDIITGVFILFQDLIAVGEVVKVGDTGGLVEAVSIRNVRLRDLSGTVHTIPFSSITTISNLTKDFSYYVLDVGVAYKEDVDEVMEILRQIGKDLRSDPEFAPLILAPLEVLGLDKFADSAIIIKARIKTIPIQQWAVGRELNRRMKRRFDELGIEIPFPHQTVYFGADKEGGAPPARIMLGPALAVQPSSLDLLTGTAGAKPSGGGSG
jgi:small conductance mechanosensitive channel